VIVDSRQAATYRQRRGVRAGAVSNLIGWAGEAGRRVGWRTRAGRRVRYNWRGGPAGSGQDDVSVLNGAGAGRSTRQV